MSIHYYNIILAPPVSIQFLLLESRAATITTFAKDCIQQRAQDGRFNDDFSDETEKVYFTQRPENVVIKGEEEVQCRTSLDPHREIVPTSVPTSVPIIKPWLHVATLTVQRNL